MQINGTGSFVITPSLVAWLIERSENRKGASLATYNAAFGAGVAIGAMGLGPVLTAWHQDATVFWIAALFSTFGLTVLLSKSKKTEASSL